MNHLSESAVKAPAGSARHGYHAAPPHGRQRPASEGMSVIDPLGAHPARSVAALADLGLSDTEIARYYGVGLTRIRTLRANASGRGPGGLNRVR